MNNLGIKKVSIYMFLNFFALCLLVSYLRCCLTNPGFVKEGWQTEGIAPAWIENGARMSTTCRTCGFDRPLRAHHCRKCNQCVLRMDHHCPWINNCVGFYNHRFFILFIFYLPVCAFLAIASILVRVSIENVASGTARLAMSISIFLCVLAMILSAGQWATQWNLVISNLTSIEEKELDFQKEKSVYLKVLPCQTHLYNHGPIGNLKILLGSQWWWWWAPIPVLPSDSQDGYYYQINPTAAQIVQTHDDTIRARVRADLISAGLINENENENENENSTEINSRTEEDTLKRREE